MSHDEEALCSSPRVEALIEKFMRRYPGIGTRSNHAYFEVVHQALAPLARELEQECAEQARALELLAQLHPCLTVNRDQPMEMALAIFDQVLAEKKALEQRVEELGRYLRSAHEDLARLRQKAQRPA